MDIGYGLFMAEAEGYLPTREGKLNALIKHIKYNSSPYEINDDYLNDLVEQFGLDEFTLTEREINRIKEAAMKVIYSRP